MPFKKLITGLMMVFCLVFMSNFVLAFELGDLFGGKDKKTNYYATVDMDKLKDSVSAYKKYEDQIASLDEAYSDYSKEVLLEQKEASSALFHQYQQESLGMGQSERENALERYKQQVVNLARSSQRQLDQKKAEIEMKKSEVQQNERKLTRRLLRQTAKKKKVSVVVDKRNAYYFKNDITDDVIKAVKKEERGKFLGIF
ncbi:MAG TPA: OmpH family outer membrane protein [Bacillota bacterium]|nr:OmpH family outer membrane protein [Bacillota bacterium]